MTTLDRSTLGAIGFGAAPLGNLYRPLTDAAARATNRAAWDAGIPRSEEHTSELQSLMRISYAVFCLKKKKIVPPPRSDTHQIRTSTYIIPPAAHASVLIEHNT